MKTILTAGLFFGCVPKDSTIAVNFNKKNNSVSQIYSANVSSVQIVNNQLVITGNGLTAVTNVKVDGTAFTENFSIESKSATQIIANSIRAFSFDVSKVFNVILSDANASATFPIDFSLCNATLNGKGFNCATSVADKDVLSYDAAGNFGINTVVPDAKLMVNSGSTIGRYTATGWLHSSDARLKHDINTITNATEKILKLRGVDYILNNDPTNERQLGFIAQEVEPLFPEVVRTDKNGYKSMVYANLVAPLVEAFKDLYKKVTDIFMTTEKNTRAIASVNLKIKKLEDENRAKSKEITELKAYLCSKDPHAPVCK